MPALLTFLPAIGGSGPSAEAAPPRAVGTEPRRGRQHSPDFDGTPPGQDDRPLQPAARRLASRVMQDFVVALYRPSDMQDADLRPSVMEPKPPVPLTRRKGVVAVGRKVPRHLSHGLAGWRYEADEPSTLRLLQHFPFVLVPERVKAGRGESFDVRQSHPRIP